LEERPLTVPFKLWIPIAKFGLRERSEKFTEAFSMQTVLMVTGIEAFASESTSLVVSPS
jgi:hypothetical protein